MGIVNLSPATICDTTCFYDVGHEGLHQNEHRNLTAYNMIKENKMTTPKRDPIREALERVAEAANALATHGAGGYDTGSSALDTVFLRALVKFRSELGWNDKNEWYDPTGELYTILPSDYHGYMGF